MQDHPDARRRTIRVIAVFELIKGLAAFAAAIGLLELMHLDVRHIAAELIGRFGLSPLSRYPSLLLHYADLLPTADVRLVLLFAVGYILLRLLEFRGLWHDEVWGEWLGAVSGGLYIPFELRHLLHTPSLSSALILAGNVFVVGFLGFELWRRKKLSQLHGAS